MRLIELGKVYLDLGYLTQSLQVYRKALDTAEESDSDKAKHQVNLAESPLGYLTQSLQVLDIVKEKESYSGKAAHQVNFGESPMWSTVTVFLTFQRITIQIMLCCAFTIS